MRYRTLAAAGLVGVAVKAFDLIARGALTVDVGIGRRVRPLGPVTWTIAAPRTLVFDLIEGPYRRTPRALQDKLQVWEQGSDMALAAHVTTVGRRRVTTVETVRFERPERIHFRVVRGPVPHVSEEFVLTETADGTELTWQGELGTDLGFIGELWGERVAKAWRHAVGQSIASVKAEAERRTRARDT
jgi:Polyketide cyclase / dehydrase and lipid transport